MPTARPIMVITLTANTDMVNAWPVSAVSASATTIARAASSRGSPAATRAPNTITRITRAIGRPMRSPRTRSEADGGGLPLPGGAARERHGEPGLPRGLLDDRDEEVEVRLGGAERNRQAHGQDRRVPVPRHQERGLLRRLRVEVGADLGDVCGRQGAETAGELADEGAEHGVVDGQARGSDDDDLDVVARAGRRSAMSASACFDSGLSRSRPTPRGRRCTGSRVRPPRPARPPRGPP